MLFVASCSGASTSNVEDVYRKYASAVSNQRGYDVADLVSSSTLRHYEGLKTIALSGGSDRADLTLYDEIAVYYFRAKFEPSALSRMQGRDVINILTREDMLGIPRILMFQLTDLNGDEGRLRGRLVSSEDKDPYSISFILEKGDWKIDSASLRTSREDILVQRMFAYGGSRDDVIDELLKTYGVSSGLTPSLRKPLRD